MLENLRPRPFRNGFRSRAFLLAISVLTLASCAPATDGAAENLSRKAGDTIGCAAFSDSIFDELYKFPLEKRQFPSRQSFESALENSFSNGRLARLDEADRTRLKEMTSELYDLLSIEIEELSKVSGENVLQTLSAIELGDRTTPEKMALQEKLSLKFKEIENLTRDLSSVGVLSECAPSKTPPDESSAVGSTLFEKWKSSRHPAVYGGLKALATTYQSCTAGTVSPVTASTPDVQGISIVGTHTDGIGSKRQVSDLSALLKSHVYLKNYKKPASGSSCFDVKAKPAIYDYGGRPYTTSSETSKFDLFRDEGSGTSVLGIDCSAYVYVAYAAAGLKLKSTGRLKAMGVQGINSRMFVDPTTSKLDCLAHAKFTASSSLKPGDIISKPGHVFMVETVGSDPFGISGIKSIDKCTLSNISVSKFDFTILQSSNSKNGIGTHRAKAADFLSETPSMSEGLRQHAVNACKAKFNQTTSSRVTDLSIVRHSGSSACRDTSIAFERESCVSSCEAPAQI